MTASKATATRTPRAPRGRKIVDTTPEYDLQAELEEFLAYKRSTKRIKGSTSYCYTHAIALFYTAHTTAGRHMYDGSERKTLLELLPTLPRTMHNRELSYMKSFWNWCIQEKNLLEERNPARGIKPLPETPRTVHAEEEQIKAIVEELHDQYKKTQMERHLRNLLLFVTLAYAGTRETETGLIQRKNFNLQVGEIAILAESTKTGKPRSVPIPFYKKNSAFPWLPALWKTYLRSHMANYDSDGTTLFCTSTGKAMGREGIRMAMVPLVKKYLGEKATVHDLRHVALTRLARLGASTATIMKVAGHATERMTQRYVNRTPQELVAEVNTLLSA